MLEKLENDENVFKNHKGCCGNCIEKISEQPAQLRSILIDNLGEYVCYDNIFIEFSNPVVAHDDCGKKRYFYTARGELFNNKNDGLKAKILFSNLLENQVLFEAAKNGESRVLRNPYKNDYPGWTDQIEYGFGGKNLFLISLNANNFSGKQDIGAVLSLYSSILDVWKEIQTQDEIASLRSKIFGMIKSFKAYPTKKLAEDKVGINFLQGIIEEGIYTAAFFDKLEQYHNNRSYERIFT